MIRDDIRRMAEQSGASQLANVPGFTEFLARFAALAYEAGAASERERIIAANAPEIERINAHIKELEQARAEERTRACRIVTGLCISDNNAREINEAIRAQAADRLARHGIHLPDEDEEYGNPSF
jgi:hypothetical protein